MDQLYIGSDVSYSKTGSHVQLAYAFSMYNIIDEAFLELVILFVTYRVHM